MKIKEIAKIANVSPATVSLVINNKPGVSESTRKRILEIINDFGYKVNNPIIKKEYLNIGNIRFLKYKKYGSIVEENGEIINNITDGINKEATKFGYNVIIATIDSKNYHQVMENINNGDDRGVVLLGTELDKDDIHLIKKINLPIVVIDNALKFEEYDCIFINNEEGAYQGVRKLIDRGYDQVGYLRSSIKIDNFLARYEGYKSALKQHGIRHSNEHIFFLEPTLEGSYRDMKRILQTGVELPHAFFADSDTIACGAIKALKENGFSIPDDISIIGFNDISYSTMIDPALSTMKIYSEELGVFAIRRLIEKIKYNDETTIKLQVQAKYIERKSTKKK